MHVMYPRNTTWILCTVLIFLLHRYYAAKIHNKTQFDIKKTWKKNKKIQLYYRNRTEPPCRHISSDNNRKCTDMYVHVHTYTSLTHFPPCSVDREYILKRLKIHSISALGMQQFPAYSKCFIWGKVRDWPNLSVLTGFHIIQGPAKTGFTVNGKFYSNIIILKLHLSVRKSKLQLLFLAFFTKSGRPFCRKR